ncbi:MAG: TniQ family protein [Rhodocyclaceae bacterium]|nr:TniQ family protein [Rhodocyclaceae bacterium]
MDCLGRNLPRAKKGRRSRNARDALTRPLWPVHFKPLPDELLSSWLVRLASAHGLKVQTLSRLLAGSDYQLWNRDLDRVSPAWLLDALCWKTATPPEVGVGTTLKAYEGKIYRTFHDSYVLPWILPLKMYHRTRRGYGLQFCGRCLATDPEPYFRKRWRVAFYTWCAIHNVMLQDRCPNCGAPVIFQRRELGRPKEVDGGSIAQCYACDFDFRESPVAAPVFYEESAQRAFDLAARRLEHHGPWCKPRSVRYYNVLHHLCWMMTAHYRNARPLEFAGRQVGAPELLLSSQSRTFEMRSIAERHHMVQLGFWYLAEMKERLTAAWHDGAVTYSALLRDFEDRPKPYNEIVARFSDWRSR